MQPAHKPNLFRTLGFLAAMASAVFGSAALAQDTAEPPIYVMPKEGPVTPEKVPITNLDQITAWIRSGHSDASSEAFTHWNADGEIPPVCSTCHSGAGFRSLYGLDGSQPGLPESPMPIGGVVDCDTCHNPGLAQITEVKLPNGMMHPVANGEASCMTCHQGRAAGAQVAAAIEGKDDDTPDADLRFINPHYATAAASMLGGYAGLGYQYPGKDYEGRFMHAKPVATCVACHDPHSLSVNEAVCLTCHTTGTPQDIRISRQSYDGSGDTSKGISYDVKANSDLLLKMIKDYAAQVLGAPMVYDGASYPYFFADANGDGVIDTAEGKPVAYSGWTPRMLRAVYNWKFVTADHAIFVHNPHYALELIHDSIEDLAGPLGVDMASLGIAR